MNRQERRNAAEMLRLGYDKSPKAMYFVHTDANGVKYKVINHAKQKKGDYYLSPTGKKRQWEVKQAQNDFAERHETIVTVIKLGDKTNE